MLYDHRNLITELKHRSQIIGDTVFLTKYYYDEAGNRIRKMTYKYLESISEGEPPANSDVIHTSQWLLRNDEIYSRGVDGKELAIYKNGSILQWNMWGIDNVGKINSDLSKYYYFKDHLGSVRAVTDGDAAVLSAQDYDPWGYLLDERKYNSEDSKFKFTGKERDEESFYDYFGARYYDARIGRWGAVEPLMEKYISYSPYAYSSLNPLSFIDYNGKKIKISNLGTSETSLINDLQEVTGLKLSMKDGSLTYDKEQALQTELGGSESARNFLIDAIDNTAIEVNVFTTDLSTYSNDVNIYLNVSQISGYMNNSYGVDDNTLGWALVLIHELFHTSLGGSKGKDEPTLKFGEVGEIETLVNEMRSELGYDKRFSYPAAKLENNRIFYPFNKETRDHLLEGKTPKQGKHKFVEEVE